jgi:hypothetical protein
MQYQVADGLRSISGPQHTQMQKESLLFTAAGHVCHVWWVGVSDEDKIPRARSEAKALLTIESSIEYELYPLSAHPESTIRCSSVHLLTAYVELQLCRAGSPSLARVSQSECQGIDLFEKRRIIQAATQVTTHAKSSPQLMLTSY